MKQSKYKNSNYEAHKKVRKTWNVNPVERVVPHKTDDVGSNKAIRQAIEDWTEEQEEEYWAGFYNDVDAEDFG